MCAASGVGRRGSEVVTKRLLPPAPTDVSQDELDAAVDDDACVAVQPQAIFVEHGPQGMSISISFNVEPVERELRRLANEAATTSRRRARSKRRRTGGNRRR